MRQLKAAILLLLFIATFGRCFAEQYGVIAGTELECCVEEHSDCCAHEDPADHEDEAPVDCPVCVLIDNNALLATAPTDLPLPVYSLASTFLAIEIWHPEPLGLGLDRCDPGDERIPLPPPRQSLSLTELVLYSAPVRGPSRV